MFWNKFLKINGHRNAFLGGPIIHKFYANHVGKTASIIPIIFSRYYNQNVFLRGKSCLPHPTASVDNLDDTPRPYEAKQMRILRTSSHTIGLQDFVHIFIFISFWYLFLFISICVYLFIYLYLIYLFIYLFSYLFFFYLFSFPFLFIFYLFIFSIPYRVFLGCSLLASRSKRGLMLWLLWGI